MRVVADTNTVVSAFLWGGLPAEVLAAARERRISLHTSPALLAELEDVLAREKFDDRITQVGSSAAQMLAGYRALATPVRPAVIEPTVRDPDDDHVLACALGAQAALIVTRDRDLLTLGTFRGIPIRRSRGARPHRRRRPLSRSWGHLGHNSKPMAILHRSKDDTAHLQGAHLLYREVIRNFAQRALRPAQIRLISFE